MQTSEPNSYQVLGLICTDQMDWADKITPVLMMYRTTVAVPMVFFATFGCQMNLGIDVTLMEEFEKSPDIQTFTANLTHAIVK